MPSRCVGEVSSARCRQQGAGRPTYYVLARATPAAPPRNTSTRRVRVPAASLTHEQEPGGRRDAASLQNRIGEEHDVVTDLLTRAHPPFCRTKIAISIIFPLCVQVCERCE